MLPGLADRWSHTQGVARKAESATAAVGAGSCELLVAAAWLHDIGYAPELAVTGLHALDGAQYLAGAAWPSSLCCLVAHHSAASVEAEQRGLAEELAAFPMPDSVLLDALTYADMTTSPQGMSVTVEERLAEILRRYPPEHPVHRSVGLAADRIRGAVERTERRLRVAPQPM